MAPQRKRGLARRSAPLRRSALRRKAPRGRAHAARADAGADAGGDAVRAPTELEHAFARLELEPTRDLARVRRAYRALIARFHPDKSAQRGPELRRAAEAQTRAIIRAYELVVESIERA